MASLLSQLTLLVPLFALAGSAAAFVWKQYLDRTDRRRREMFELMTLLDQPETLASKLAAIYSLRSFHEHKDFILRFCTAISNSIEGEATDLVQRELSATADHMRSLK